MARPKGVKEPKVSVHVLLEPTLKEELDKYSEANKLYNTDVIKEGILKVIRAEKQ